ncbi:MAG: hypothetical protein AAFZ18_25810 [Myxococcota bacterium]
MTTIPSYPTSHSTPPPDAPTGEETQGPQPPPTPTVETLVWPDLAPRRGQIPPPAATLATEGDSEAQSDRALLGFDTRPLNDLLESIERSGLEDVSFRVVLDGLKGQVPPPSELIGHIETLRDRTLQLINEQLGGGERRVTENTPLGGLKATLNELKKLGFGETAPASRSLIRLFDRFLPFTSKGGSGVGGASIVNGRIEGRPAGFPDAMVDLLGRKSAQALRHITASHSIKEAFNWLLEHAGESFEKAVAQHIDANIEALLAENPPPSLGDLEARARMEPSDSSKSELDHYKDLQSYIFALSLLEAVPKNQKGDFKNDLPRLLAWAREEGNLNREKRTLLAFTMAHLSPSNLWPGNSDENSLIAIVASTNKKKLDGLETVEDLRALLAKPPFNDLDPSRVPPNESVVEAFNRIAQPILSEALARAERAPDVTEQAKIIAEAKDLLEDIIYANLETDLISREGRGAGEPGTADIFLKAMSLEPATRLIHDIVRGKLGTHDAEDAARTILDTFLNYDPYDKLKIEFEGTADQTDRLKAAHDQLFEGSRVYRETFREAALRGDGIKLAVTDNADWKARFDLSSNTIYVSEAELNSTEPGTLMEHIANEMANASARRSFEAVKVLTATYLAQEHLRASGQPLPDREGETWDRNAFVERLIAIESDALTTFETIMKDVGADLPPPQKKPRTGPRDWTEHRAHYGQMYDDLRQAVLEGQDLSSFHFDIWRPKAPGDSGSSDPGSNRGLTGADPSRDSPRGEAPSSSRGLDGSGTSSTSRGLKFGGRADGAAGFLAGSQDFVSQEDQSAGFEITHSSEVTVGGATFKVTNITEGGAGYTANADHTSASAYFRVENSASVEGQIGYVDVELTVSQEGYAEARIRASHDFSGEDKHIGADAYLAAAITVAVQAQAELGGVTLAAGATAGAGASASGGVNIIMDDWVPGVSISGSAEAGVSVGVNGSIGNDDASLAGDAGVIAGAAIGGDGAFGMQEDGKFHVMAGGKIAAGVGLEFGFDFAIDPDVVENFIKDIPFEQIGDKLAEGIVGLLQSHGVFGADVADEMLGTLKKTFDVPAEKLKELLPDGEWVAEAWDTFSDTAKETLETVGEGAKDALDTVGDGAKKAKKKIKKVF